MKANEPWPSMVVIQISQSDPPPGLPTALTLATVAGSSSSDEAKIGGITPDVLRLSGRSEDGPSHLLLPPWRVGYWISGRRWARPPNTIKAVSAPPLPTPAALPPVG